MTAGTPNVQQNMKFTKTETEYTMKSIRFLLLTITMIFTVISGLMIVLGMSVYTHYHSFSFFFENGLSGQVFTPSILCILTGMALLIISMFGFLGSLKRSTCMVNTYAVILTMILIKMLVVVILAFTLGPHNILEHINIPIKYYTQDTEIEELIDGLQSSLNCCGSSSFQDYAGLDFTSNHTTAIFTIDNNFNITEVVVPKSCCGAIYGVFCDRIKDTGCKNALVSTFLQNASVLGVLGVSVMFIKLLGIIFALLLARCIRKMKSEKALMTWKIKEQMILARQNEESQRKTDENGVYIAHPDSSVA